jgi:hypothetical protein
MAEKLRVHLIDKEKLTVCGAHIYAKQVLLESAGRVANCGTV